VASPTTAEEINAVVKPLVESAEGALESGASKALSFLGDALGVVGAVLLNPTPLNSGEDQIVAVCGPRRTRPRQSRRSRWCTHGHCERG
jgi:hypothetical protein